MSTKIFDFVVLTLLYGYLAANIAIIIVTAIRDKIACRINQRKTRR